MTVIGARNERACAAIEQNAAARGNDALKPRHRRPRLLGEWRRTLRQQPIDRDLRLRGGGEKRAFVVSQELHPMTDIGSVIVDVMGRQTEDARREARADLGHKLFGRQRVLAELLAHVTPDAVRRHGRVHALMVERRRVVFGRIERRDRRHADDVAAWDVAGDVARRDPGDLQLLEPGFVRSDRQQLHRRPALDETAPADCRSGRPRRRRTI